MSRRTRLIGPSGEVHLLAVADYAVAADPLRKRGPRAADTLDRDEHARQVTDGRTMSEETI